MDNVRESMKVELHNAAIEELRMRRLNAAQKRKMKRQSFNHYHQLLTNDQSSTNYQDFFVDESSIGTFDVSLTQPSITISPEHDH